MIFGISNIKLEWEFNSTTLTITIPKNTYIQKYKYGKVNKKKRRDARNGNKKVIFKGNYQKFEITVLNISKLDYDNYYKNLNNPDLGYIKVYPHSDLDKYYKCYTDEQEFELFEDQLNQGMLTIKFKASEYSDTRTE